MTFSIREAVAADAPALAALERASPETGSIAVRIDLTSDPLMIAGRYPGVRGFVAVHGAAATVIGMLFVSVGPTQLDGGVVPGAYLFSLRVHPACRRRGVASALIGQAGAWSRGEAGADLLWAAVSDTNTGSLRSFRRAGFGQERVLRMYLGPPWPAPDRPVPGLMLRPAGPRDLADLSEALNGHYARHQLWRPLPPDRLAAELAAIRQTPADVLLGLDPNGAIVAAAGGVAYDRIAGIRLLGWRPFGETINRWLGPAYGLLPVRPLVLRHILLPSALEPTAGAAFLRRAGRRFGASPMLVAALDPLDPARPFVGCLPGLRTHVRLLVNSSRMVAGDRPWYFG